MTSNRTSPAPTLIFPVIILIAYSWLATRPNLALAVPELVSACAFIVITLAAGQFWCKRTGLSWSPALILGTAVLSRFMFLDQDPVLSDDLYRYLLDGMMTVHGHNPYAMAPLDAHGLVTGADGLIPLINHNNIPTIYPPAAQAVFGAGALAGEILGPIPGMKLVLVILDLGSCVLVLQILKTLGQPRHRAILYAWNPLPVLEIGASGHIDGAAVFFLLAAITLALTCGPRQWRAILSGSAMAMAVLTKWLPLLFVPVWLHLIPENRRQTAITAAVLVSAGLIMPFCPELKNSLATLALYLRHWEFSGFFFRLLRLISLDGQASRIILAGIFMTAMAVIHLKLHRFRSVGASVSAVSGIAMTYLVLAPTLYPWYALYLAAFLPMSPTPAGITLCWSVLLSYGVLIAHAASGIWAENPCTPLMIVSAPAAAAAAAWVINVSRARQKAAP